MTIGQDARVFVADVEPGKTVEMAIEPKRCVWVQVAKGSATLNGQQLAQGDGAGVQDEASLTIAGSSDAQVLVFDLA